MQKQFIVGGAGFIGAHLVEVALAQGCQVWVYDDFSVGRRQFLPDHDQLQIVEGDILDTAQLSAAIAQAAPDTLYHLAAIHHIPTCEKYPEQALRVNVEGTKSVLTACAQNKTPRVIFASSGALYDPVNEGALAETSPVRAHDIYSISKLTGEYLLQYHVAKEGGETIIARFFNVVGRRETNPHVIPTIMGQLAAGSRQIKLGNLHPRRDYIHVEDVAEALFALAALTLTEPCEVFNVGSGHEHSVQNLVELCAEAVGEPIEIISAPEFRRKFDRPSQLADIEKIQSRTGWRPTRTLRQALVEVWAETQANAGGGVN
jgi:UDP-glucose 4-epimerase